MSKKTEVQSVIEAPEVAPAVVAMPIEISPSRARTIQNEVDNNRETTIASMKSSAEMLRANGMAEAADALLSKLPDPVVKLSEYATAYNAKYDAKITAADWEASVLTDGAKVERVIAGASEALEAFTSAIEESYNALFEALKPGLDNFGLDSKLVKIEIEDGVATVAARGKGGTGGPKGKDVFTWTPGAAYLCKRGLQGGKDVEYFLAETGGQYAAAVKVDGTWAKFGEGFKSANIAMKAITLAHLGKEVQESAHRPVNVWIDGNGEVFTHANVKGDWVDAPAPTFDKNVFVELRNIATAPTV